MRAQVNLCISHEPHQGLPRNMPFLDLAQLARIWKSFVRLCTNAEHS
jgi:hypothetical protein